MKKTTRIAALLAAAALIFGGLFFSCSDSDDGGNTGSTTTGGATDTGTDSSTSTPAAYTLDFSKCEKVGNKDSYASTEKKVDDVVTLIAQADNKAIDVKTSYLKMTSGSANITDNTKYGVQITLAQKADITIKALSKESSVACQWVLKTASDTIESTGSPAVASAQNNVENAAELKFADVAAGTYMLGAKSNGGYLTSLVITYK
ncbi:MAG: hypothetical protein NC041_06695 [Bacteroides sp.]|nr:hypothetical protein [Prevotella sp.]MCM1406984.1 hypothetical protein [Treponema brennaborense]MCM1470135.1 hypothetical protein [Bacteroides sp.]